MSAIEVRKREGESSGSLLFRFSRRVRQSGILAEARRRRFKTRPVSRRQRRLSAVYRAAKQRELEQLKKLGLA